MTRWVNTFSCNVSVTKDSENEEDKENDSEKEDASSDEGLNVAEKATDLEERDPDYVVSIGMFCSLSSNLVSSYGKNLPTRDIMTLLHSLINACGRPATCTPKVKSI